MDKISRSYGNKALIMIGRSQNMPPNGKQLHEANYKLLKYRLEVEPNNVDLLYEFGMYNLNGKNYTLTSNIIQRLRRCNMIAYADTLEGHICLHRGELPMAFRMFNSAYNNIKHLDPFLIFGIGIFYETIGEYEVALNWLLLLSGTKLHDLLRFEIMFRLSMCCMRLKYYSEALRFAKCTMPSNELENIYKRTQIAHIYERAGLDKSALKKLYNILVVDKEILALRLYCWLLYKLKKFSDLEDIYYNEEICVEDPYILYLISRIKIMHKDYHAAIDIIKSILNPDHNVYNSLGISYLSLRKYEKARIMFNKAIELSPNWKNPMSNLEVVDMCEQTNEDLLYLVSESDPNMFKTKYIDSNLFFGIGAFDNRIKENSGFASLDFRKFLKYKEPRG